MRNFGQPQVAARFGEVVEKGDDAAVVGLEKGFQGQDGEQLELGEIVSAGRTRVGWQRFPGESQAFARDPPWRFGHGSGNKFGIHGT